MTDSADLVVDVSSGLELLGATKRLADTPPTAAVRGIFFRLAEQCVAERSSQLLTVWRAACGVRFRWPFKLYPAREFIREQAVAAVLLGPTNPGEELRRMWASTPKLSPNIRAEGFMRYLTGKDPMRALTWLEQNRRMMNNYGDWWVVPDGTNAATFHHRDEYTWIEHCHVGGMEGTLRRCGVTPTMSVELDSPYSGRVHASW